MAEQMNFTKSALAELLQKRGGERLLVRDSKCRGLVADLRPGGSLVFYLRRRINGRPSSVRIGPFPALSVDDARKAVAKMQGAIADGKDPRAERERSKTAPTLADLHRHWMESHAKPHKRSWPEDQRQYDKFLSKLGTRKLSDIRRGEVVALHTRIGRENGHYAANRVLALLRAMYGKAVEIGYEGPNPCNGIGTFREESRDRFLQPDELPKFFAALDEETELFRDYFLVSLLVGARRGNVQAMRWEEISFDAATWRMPRTKNSDPLTVPLCPAALATLQRRKESANGSPWVFPSRGRTGHLVEPKTAWKRILNRAGLTDLRIHDLRRTLGSWQASTGASLPVIGKSLGHRSQQATAVYARMNLDPVRASVNTATDAILLAAGRNSGNGSETSSDESGRDATC